MSTRGFIGFKKDGVVKGWYNHSDSYPDCLGYAILEEAFCKYDLDTLKEFFTKRLKLVKRNGGGGDPVYEAHKSVLSLDWRTDSVELLDDSEFIKDGLYCEYAYVFNLDKPVKELLLFKGFGKGPSRGYEDWYYQTEPSTRRGLDGEVQESPAEKLYQNYKGSLSGELILEKAKAKMMKALDSDK